MPPWIQPTAPQEAPQFPFQAQDQSDKSTDKASSYALDAKILLGSAQLSFGIDGRGFAKDGLELINAAIALRPEIADYWNVKGLLLAEGLGRREEGLDCIKKALALDPSAIVIRQNLRKLQTQMLWRRVFAIAAIAVLGFLVVLLAMAILQRR